MSYSREILGIIYHFNDSGLLRGYSARAALGIVRHYDVYDNALGYSKQNPDGGYEHHIMLDGIDANGNDDKFDDIFENIEGEFPDTSTKSFNSAAIPGRGFSGIFSPSFRNSKIENKGNSKEYTENKCENEEDDVYDIDCSSHKEDENGDYVVVAEVGEKSPVHKSCGNVFSHQSAGFSLNLSDAEDDVVYEDYDYRNEFPDGPEGDAAYEDWLDDLND